VSSSLTQIKLLRRTHPQCALLRQQHTPEVPTLRQSLEQQKPWQGVVTRRKKPLVVDLERF
jgi:hypothetical protein